MENVKVTTLELTAENVVRIFTDCCFKNEEIKEERPIYDFNIGEGIKSNVVFSTERLNQHRMEIAQLIDMLPGMDAGQSFLNLCNDKDGNQWADLHQTVEQLIQLGIACEILSYPIKREMWSSLPGGVPYVSRNKSKINTPVVGKKPEEFPVQETRKEDEEKKAAQEEKFLKEVKGLALSNFHANYFKAQPIFMMLGFRAEEKDSEILVYDLNGILIGNMTIDWVMGGTNLTIETPKGALSYIVCIDKKCDDGGDISRNIISLSDLKQINDDDKNKQFSGKCIHIELGKGLIFDSSIPRIDITVIDPNAENRITEFKATSFSFDASIENAFGPYGNYINGIHRSISYSDAMLTPYRYPHYFMSYESVWNGDANYINLQSNHNELGVDVTKLETTNFKNSTTGVHDFSTHVNQFQIYGIAKQLLCAKRTKNLAEYVLSSINQTIPGIRDYIMREFNLMVKIKQLMDTNNNGLGVSEEIEGLFDACRIEACDFICEKSVTLGNNGLLKSEK